MACTFNKWCLALFDRVRLQVYRKRHDVLEYLDLCSDPAVRLLTSCCSQKMYSQSLCNCYCKTRVPITRQREEIHSERSHVGSCKSFTPKFPKADTSRSGKKIPLIPARVIADEQLDSKRSTVTFPVSPTLSPETSAVLENVEKLINDAAIQMKEININRSAGRFRKHVNAYTDEALLDDENDQLLYIRERVACKFQEANGWVDATTCTNPRRKQFSKEEHVATKPKRIIDLHASKFKTVEDRYKEFSRQGKLQVEKFGAPASPVDQCANDEKTKISDLLPSAIKKIDKNKKIVACSMQTGLSVDIKGELKVENLEEIHISPDPSFVHENRNVATYIICHDFHQANSSPRRREKFVKILEDSDDNNIDRKSTNETMRRRNTGKNRDEIRNGSSPVDVPRKVDTISEGCRDVFTETKEEIVETDGRLNKIEKPAVETILQNEKYLESIVCSDEKSSNANDESSQHTFDIKQDVEVRKEEVNEPSMKIVDRNGQRQVRFDERALETGNSKNSIESRGKGEVVVGLDQDLVIPSISNNLEYRTVTKDSRKDNTERFKVSSPMKEIETNNEHASLSGKEIEEKHSKNKNRYKEVCENRKAKKDERSKMIDERFARIVQTYCKRNEECMKINGSCVMSSTSKNSTEDSEDSDDLYNLYEHSTNQLDNVLISYNKIIDNVVRSTKTINEFLSRPEIKQYYVENAIRTKGSKKKVIATSSQSRKKIEKPKAKNLHRLQAKHVTELRIKDSIIHDRSSATTNNWDLNHKQVKSKKDAPFKKSVIIKEDGESRTKRVASKRADKVPLELNLEMKDRDRVWRKLPKEESAESSENNNGYGSKLIKINHGKRIRFHETRSFPSEKDSSTVTTSSICPLSSSSEIRTANDTKLSLEFTKSTVKGDTANVISNRVESEKKNISKHHFDYRTFRNVVCSSVLKQVCPEMKNAEQLIARVVREETRFIEDKMKNIFNVDEIVGLIVKSLMESLRGERSNFEAKDLELLIGENIAVGDVACASSRIIETIETARSSGDSEKCGLQIECLESEENCSRIETIKGNEEVVEKCVSNRSDLNSKNQLALISDEKVSRNKKENSPIERDNGKLNPIIPSLNENFHETSRQICDKKNSAEIEEQIISVDNKQSQIKENNKEMLDLLIDRSQVINEHIKNKERKTTDMVEENDLLKDEYKIVFDVNKIPLATNNEETEDALQKDFSIFNKTAITEDRKQKSVELYSCEKKTKASGIPGSNFSHVSSSDSLRDCVSLRSTSNNVELSQDVNEIEEFSEMRNAIDDRVTNCNSSCFDKTFDKKQILLNVYDEVHRKFLSSTFETNYSSVLNQQFRLSNGVSTISTIESNKIEISSDASHSEGELYFPSSGSYSLGEIRILEKNHSEGENADDLDDIPIFVTKEMLTSWNESSKSLVQSMGEI